MEVIRIVLHLELDVEIRGTTQMEDARPFPVARDCYFVSCMFTTSIPNIDFGPW